MVDIRSVLVLLVVAVSALTAAAGRGPRQRRDKSSVSASELLGVWEGVASHNGDRTHVRLRIERGDADQLSAKWSTPDLDAVEMPVGPVEIRVASIHAGPLALTFHRSSGTLSTTLPAALVPVYSIRVTFHKSVPRVHAPRAFPESPVATPVWTFDAAAPIWSDTALDRGRVLVGDDAGGLHAIDAASGVQRWRFQAGGAIRARPTCSSGAVYIQADDGLLYKIDAADGSPIWRVRINQGPIRRLPLSDPQSRYDLRASAVAVANDRLYVGTDDGRLLALSPADGATVWSFRAGDSVTATPRVAGGLVYAGSFDGRLYALDADSGRVVWSHDTGAPITTSATTWRDAVIVGSRSYDLSVLGASDGRTLWTRYYWFSWVESVGSVSGRTVYIGSSDAANVYAFDMKSGARRWTSDVGGSAWGQPGVTASRVFEGTAGMQHYAMPHRAALFALDRVTGQHMWHFSVPPPNTSEPGTVPYGFAASLTLDDHFVYIGSLEGKVYAFRQ